MFKAVTFDLWNTLLDGSVDYRRGRIDVLRDMCAGKGCFRDRRLIDCAYHKVYSSTYANPSCNVATDVFVQRILDEIDVSLSRSDRRQVVKAFAEVILANPPGLLDDAPVLLKKISQTYKIGLICNTGVTPGRTLRQVLQNYGIAQYFTCLVFSNEVGVTKPHPAIFTNALTRLRASPTECVHVGDLLETDVVGAKAAGMSAIWVNRADNDVDKSKLSYAPDLAIKTLISLLDVL